MNDAASSGGAGEAPSSAQPQTSAPAPTRTPEQASAALDARVADKISRAEHGEHRAPSQIVDEDEKATETAKPEEQLKPDPQTEQLKTEHEALKTEADTLRKTVEEWDSLAEKMVARHESMKSYIAQLEEQLAALGGSIDPRDLELATYRERVRAQELAEERAAYAQQQQQQQQESERARQAAYRGLTEQTKSALTEHPELLEPANRQELVKALQLIYRGGDAKDIVTMVSSSIRAKSTAPKAPKTLAGTGMGAGAPKLRDPRDIADKWKARLAAG